MPILPISPISTIVEEMEGQRAAIILAARRVIHDEFVPDKIFNSSILRWKRREFTGFLSRTREDMEYLRLLKKINK